MIKIQTSPGWLNELGKLPNNSYKPIANMAWVRARLCKLQKGSTRLTATSDKVYQLLAHGRLFSPGIPTFSTTKTGRHDISEILLKVALKHLNQIKSNQNTNKKSPKTGKIFSGTFFYRFIAIHPDILLF